MRTIAAALISVLLCGCGGGRAVRVDCDGPLLLINPPASPANESSDAAAAASKPLSHAKRGRRP